MPGVTHDLSNADLFSLYRHRDARRLDRLREAVRVRNRLHHYLDGEQVISEWQGARDAEAGAVASRDCLCNVARPGTLGLGDVVLPSKFPTRGHWWPARANGLRKAAQRFGADMRPAADDEAGLEHEVRAACSRDELRDEEIRHCDLRGHRAWVSRPDGWDGY